MSKGKKRDTERKIVHSCVQRTAVGKYQLVFDNPMFEDLLRLE